MPSASRKRSRDLHISFEKSSINDENDSLGSSLSFFSNTEKEDIFECLRRTRSGLRSKSKSLDQPELSVSKSIRPFGEAKTLSGAIVMLLSENHFLTVPQIVEKIKPVYHAFRKGKNNTEDMAKQVERILFCGRKKLFQQEKEGYWKLKHHKLNKNYFAIMENKVDHKITKKKPKIVAIRKKRSKTYEDTIEKLSKALRYIKENTNLYTMVKSNPFARFKNIELSSDRCAEEVLTILAGCKDPAKQTERIVGILQCFYHFYPILTGSVVKQQFVLNKIHQSILKATGKLNSFKA